MSSSITHLFFRQFTPDDTRGRLYALRVDRIDQALTVPEEQDTTQQLSQKLSNIVGFIKTAAQTYVKQTLISVTGRKRNDLVLLPSDLNAALGGSLENVYYYGSWDLSEDEVLLVEVKPGEAPYWSVAAHNSWYQAMEHSSIPQETKTPLRISMERSELSFPRQIQAMPTGFRQADCV